MFQGTGSGTITPREYTATCVAGTWLQALPTIMAGVVVQIYIKPDTDTSMYDFRIKDAKDRIVYSNKNITGLLNELDKHPPIAQAMGPYSLQIVNASLATETFDVLIMIQEMR